MVLLGGQEKSQYVANELGFDQCIDYKNENVADKLQEYCPNGIDIYFENVGGDITRSVAKHLNKGARVPVCGFISKYNSADITSEETPFHVLGALKPKPEHRFFVVTEWMNKFIEATSVLHDHVKNGNIKYRETITDGFENAPQALRDVLSGKKLWKTNNQNLDNDYLLSTLKNNKTPVIELIKASIEKTLRRILSILSRSCQSII